MDESLDNYLSEGWQLSEFINWITYEGKESFIDMIGEKNIVIIDQKEKPHDNKWKGKLLISPIGIERLNLLFIPAAGTA